MVHFVRGDDPISAWRRGSRFLLSSQREALNLVTEITNERNFTERELDVRNPVQIGAEDARIVCRTIWPEKLWRHSHGRHDLYRRYKRMQHLAKVMRRTNPTFSSARWGTYFERLTNFPPHGTNQLERAITVLNGWGRNHKAAIVFHLSAPGVDQIVPIGAPCWQYGELSVVGGRLHMTVVYRNHDFLNKALGNFVGLIGLQKHISHETGIELGALVCHSVHAYVAQKGRELATLIQ